MLKHVTFQNLGIFKSEKQFYIQAYSLSGSSEGCLSILIGESGSGKTCAIEFIRRCMSEEITKSESNICNTNKEAFVKCVFDFEPQIWKYLSKIDSLNVDLPVFVENEDDFLECTTINALKWLDSVYKESNSDVHVHTGVLYKRDGVVKYKFFLILGPDGSDSDFLLLERSTLTESGKQHIILQDCKSSNMLKELTPPKDKVEESSLMELQSDSQELSSMAQPEENDRVLTIIDTFEEKFRSCLNRMTPDMKECTGQFITNVYSNLFGREGRVCFVFGHRGIGPLDSSKSERMEEGHLNYNSTVVRAESIATILSCLDEQQGKEYLKLAGEIIGDDSFEFRKNTDNRVFLVDKYNPKNEVDLLKAPEGVYEAHIIAFYLALQSNERHQTLCLEEPNRCMHPAQVERLTEVIQRTINARKVSIILSTHSRDMVNHENWKCVFCFRRLRQGLLLNHVPCDTKIVKLAPRTSFASILFASKCLLVEGIRDLRFFEGFFRAWKAFESFPCHLSNMTIFELSGIQTKGPIKRFCKQIQLPHLLWLDGDVKEIEEDDSTHQYCWRDGKDIEKAINDSLKEEKVKKKDKKKDLMYMNIEDIEALAFELIMKKAAEFKRFMDVVSNYENFVKLFQDPFLCEKEVAKSRTFKKLRSN